MTTTALLIEILLAGTLATVWVILGINLVAPGVLGQVVTLLQSLGQLDTLLAAFGLLLVYLLGWASHFMGETVLDPLFQDRFRDRFFGEHHVKFYKVRTIVFERASDTTIKDIQLDRQILRIVRAATLNLALTALLAPLQPGLTLTQSLIIGAACLAVPVLSLLYWRRRYHSTFRKFLDVYAALRTVAPEARSPAAGRGAEKRRIPPKR